MDFKKITKILILNICFLIPLFLFAEIYSYKEISKVYAPFIRDQNKIHERLGSQKAKLDYTLLKEFNYSNFKRQMRPTVYAHSSKRPIIFFGCSYMYGWGLETNQLLSTKVSNLSNRTVYNRSVAATGTQQMYHQLSREDFYKEIPDAEYIIYTYIDDHINRMYKYQLPFLREEVYLRYELKNGHLQEVHPVLLPFYSLFTVRKIQSAIEDKNSKDKDKSFNLFLTLMKESIKQAKNHYKNVKFVILLYRDPWNKELTTKQINALKDAGFIVINAEKLVGHELRSEKFRLEDDDHPSEQAWNEIAPKLVKQLNL